MLRDEIARIVYEGYTGMSWPDVDEHFNDAARKHADEIMELPEIKQMREDLKRVCDDCKDNNRPECTAHPCMVREA